MPKVQPGQQRRPSNFRDTLLETATELFRRNGYAATTVDEICAQACATKGAFFHHFKTKEAIALACLERWDRQVASMGDGVPLDSLDDPVAKTLAYLDFMIDAFSDPNLLKSCLAGTTVQEVSESHPQLRSASNRCFVSAKDQVRTLLEDACRSRRIKRDTDGLATLWVATLQGSLVLCKASRDEAVIPASLKHVRSYIASQLDRAASTSRGRKKR